MEQHPKIKQAKARTSVQITLSDGRVFSGPVGATLEKFFEAAFPDHEAPLIAALVDGQLRELTHPIERDCDVVPIDLSHSDGGRIYRRSMIFLMLVAAKRLFPEVEIHVDHSLTFGGYFCEVRNREPLTDQEIQSLCAEMRRLVDEDELILRKRVPLQEALDIFRERDELDKVAVFQSRNRNKDKDYLQLYTLKGRRDYLHGYMVPSTGYLRYFQLLSWGNGFILQFPRRHEPTKLQEPKLDPHLIRVFREYGGWLRLLRVENVGELNLALEENKLRKIILVSEALHEHRIANIANQIAKRENIRVVLIAGPSSSGKTTFSKRLAVQLLAHGVRPYALELDNYFVNREDTPLDENGEYDFEHLEAVDLDLFNEQLQALLRGERVQLPRFNFYFGKREPGQIVQLESDEVIIVEGIHGLNPRLVYALDPACTFRIYISALTQLNLDRHTRVPTTDTRLIRRIIRDARTRGYDAMETLHRWESVRRGEKSYIFPYQEYADVMFNSALVYELAALKPYAEPLLLQVDQDSYQWVEAKRLLSFLQWFRPADSAPVPENSILREFIGGLALEEFHWD